MSLLSLLIHHSDQFGQLLNVTDQCRLASACTQIRRFLCPPSGSSKPKAQSNSNSDFGSYSAFDSSSHAWIRAMRRRVQTILDSTRTSDEAVHLVVNQFEPQSSSSLSSSSSFRHRMMQQYLKWRTTFGWRAALHSLDDVAATPNMNGATDAGSSASSLPLPIVFPASACHRSSNGASGASDTVSTDADSHLLSSSFASHRYSTSSDWSPTQLRQFLHTVERMGEITRELESLNARMMVATTQHYELQNTAGESDEELAYFQTPLPIVLPWPVSNDVVEDAARLNRHPPVASRVTAPVGPYEAVDWDEREIDASVSASSDSSSAAAAASIPPPLYYGRSESLPSLSSANLSDCVSHLSSSIRGCPWPLAIQNWWDGSEGVETPRMADEMQLVARCLFDMIGIRSSDLSIWVAEQEWPGRRPIDAEAAEAEYQAEYGSNSRYVTTTMPASHNSFWSDWISSDQASGSTSLPATLDHIAALLPHSFVISFGTERCVPWPHIILAPIAPGYIGGFITGCDI